jgi:acyl carrier protein
VITDSEVEKVIYRAIDALNAERGPDQQIARSPGTGLFGADAQVDSLGLVSLIVDVESTLNAEHGLAVSLADDRALGRAQSPFATVATLRDYVMELARGG